MISSPKRPSYSITKAERVGDALLLVSERGMLRLAPQNGSILRVTYTETEAFSEEYGLGIQFKGCFSDWTYEENETEIALKMPKLAARVNRATASIIL